MDFVAAPICLGIVFRPFYVFVQSTFPLMFNLVHYIAIIDLSGLSCKLYDFRETTKSGQGQQNEERCARSNNS